ncbi:MAG: hypothetical protein V4733_08005 [Verrucomicrobiota bacterium]
MPPPQKGFKIINHRDVQYRWILRNATGVNQLLVTAAETVDGQQLLVDLPRIVSYQRVTEAIDHANSHGWTPMVKAPPLHFRYAKGSYQAGE